MTAIVAEDEAVLRADLRDKLAALWPDLQVVASASNGVEALAMFERYRPAIIFLDIEMPGLSGLDVARQIAGKCHIVFITAYDAHAVAAFEHGAIDYLLKPYHAARLSVALGRLRERIADAPAPLDDILRDLVAAAKPRDYLRWIRASRGHEVDLILVGDICYFQADTKYTGVFTAQSEALIRLSIKELAASLDPQQFWRIHRSTIVNVEAISSIRRSLGGATAIKLRARPETLPVSEAHWHLFRHM